MSGSSEKICVLNDAFRSTLQGGQVFLTPGVLSLPAEGQSALLQAIRCFDGFGADNDPYGEHDFGSLSHDGSTFFFKIECYDRNLEYGSPDPTDPAQTTRVMTVMRADEY
ncbi:DUF3768 domain-containing protein [Cohaesibacter intestini]|uniref:DUF3768 domain-containing protein n=1 Tax=Cohaesibacter intestini TaxID=2211145 RepID=UPI000DEA3343|nr:DUF3768 domain-containing protein [Cohaesibacter intestini]